MSLLEIKRVGEGPCCLCGAARPGVEVSFHDRSFNGWVCFAHFKKLLLARAEPKAAAKAETPERAADASPFN